MMDADAPTSEPPSVSSPEAIEHPSPSPSPSINTTTAATSTPSTSTAALAPSRPPLSAQPPPPSTTPTSNPAPLPPLPPVGPSLPSNYPTPPRPTVQIPPHASATNGVGRRGAVDEGARGGTGPVSYAAAAASGGGNANAAPANPPTLPAPGPPPRPKQLIYTFPSPPPDTADLLSELEEFYSYVEVPQVIEHMQSWADASAAVREGENGEEDEGLGWKGEQEFTKSPLASQTAHIHHLLATLNSPSSSPSTRHTCARHLLHLAHGCFAPGISTSPEHHLHLILTTCRVLRQAGALEGVWKALKRTGAEWEVASILPAPPGHARGGGDSDDEDHPAQQQQQQHHVPPQSEEDELHERERQDRLDEINAELALLLAVLYFMVECFRGEEQWGEELMALDPPMPIYLLNQVAGLREKNAKGYPVKKLLLLLWKSMLCTIGGMKEVERVKVLVREIEGLPKDDPSTRPEWRPWTKVSPPDLLTFRNETLAKYPSYTPPPPSALLPLPPALSALGSNPTTLDRLSAAAAPVPVRPTFSYHVNANHDPALPVNQAPMPLSNPGAGAGHWQPPTPAPSPPPSPSPASQGLNGPNSALQAPGPPAGKPKKQQFQTDQTRPFPLPFAPANFVKGRQPVPRAVEEAAELYRGNLRVSTEIWQAWKVREGFREEEMGLEKANEVERVAIMREKERREGEKRRREMSMAVGGAKGEEGRKAKALGRRLEELILADKARKGSSGGDESDAGSTVSSTKRRSLLGASMAAVDDSAIDDSDSARGGSGSSGRGDDGEGEDEDPMDPLTVLRQLGRQVKKEAEGKEEGSKEREELEVRRADLKRLERVEVVYRSTLPHLQSAVIVLLKLLLATVTANQNLPAASAPGLNGNGIAEPTSSEPPPDLSLEDCDILRHREITSKAVSAILILTLKWFKASHVMKFHYFSQLLVDSNCLLLILKMFGLQEVSTLVRIKHDRSDYNFFKFCHDHINPSTSSPRPEDALLALPPPGARSTSPGSASASVSAGDSSSTTSSGGNGHSAFSSSSPTNGGSENEDIELVSDYSWRNFFSTINFVHILQKLTKRKTHRVLLMVQYKSSAILKRILKVSHPTLQLYVLKVIKSQVPYCGRKWRQSNMKVITAIYLHCRPDLRDEWLAGVDVDNDVEESLPHEQALRSLVRYFNTKHYSNFAPGLHRRSSSLTGGNGTHSPDFNPGPVASVPLPPLSPHAAGPMSDGTSLDDVFPPARAVSSIDCDSALPLRLAYGAIDPTDDLASYAVDDLLAAGSGGALDDAVSANGTGGVVDHDDLLDFLNDPLGASEEAWERLGLEGYEGEWDDVSDSESVGGWGFMRFGEDEGGRNGEEPEIDERTSRNEWEHISPETITALEEERRAATVPSSPRPTRRRSSTGPVSPALRPVIFDRDEDGDSALSKDDSAISSVGGQDDEEGPVPTGPHSGPAIDEVELIFKR
ncbi:hypothetical protein JCM11251_004048 [Rhodosporidiobolus azoricus]